MWVLATGVDVTVEKMEVVGDWDTGEELAEAGMNGDGDGMLDGGGVLGLLGPEDCLSAERMLGGRGMEDGGIEVAYPWAEDGGVAIINIDVPPPPRRGSRRRCPPCRRGMKAEFESGMLGDKSFSSINILL